MGIRELLGLNCDGNSQLDSDALLNELCKHVHRMNFGYSPLRRWIQYEVYCYLLEISDRRSVKALFDGLEDKLYSFHREQLAVPFRDLPSVQIPMPQSDDEIDLQILSADEFHFNPPERDYKGVICAQIEAAQYPGILNDHGYGIDYTIPAESGALIHVDSSVILINSNKGTDERLYIFALPGESGAYKATFAVWKQFFGGLAPLKETEDIYLALYEYHHYGKYELQSLVDDHRLMEEFALRLAFIGSLLSEKQSFSISKESIVAPMQGKWAVFHRDTLLVDDYLFHLLDRLGYMKCVGRPLNTIIDPPATAVYSFETFPMVCENHLLSELAGRMGVSVKQITLMREKV